MTDLNIEDELLLKQDFATFEQYARSETTIFESHHDRSRIRVLILDRPMEDDKCAALASTSYLHDEDTTSIDSPDIEGSVEVKVAFETTSNGCHVSELDDDTDTVNGDALPEYTPKLHIQTVQDDEKLENLIERTKHSLRVL